MKRSTSTASLDRKALLSSLTQQLDELAEENHTGAGVLRASVDQNELLGRMTTVDRLACEVERITVTAPHLAQLTADQLRRLADELCQRLDYLEERLGLLEVDQAVSQLQLRSQPPRRDEQTRTYYEVTVSPEGITLQRYAKQPGAARQTRPAVLTRDILCRLCGDLLSAAA